ncbi:hypothetical protein PUV54_00215 [Hyphococcus flavus]|uniref:Uncharacterized protein n=1 Tax=Hyphococcus flavus TaxID=1866326 RepID=A0AAF0CH86_9PROT|nr:HTH domain-containing protein [Hyphococcus flavus]WDI31617.1 hypothetical protein PUV54_00215 [Hyphococcus flavus]
MPSKLGEEFWSGEFEPQKTRDDLMRLGAAQGMSAQSLGDRFGVSRSTVIKRAEKIGVEFHPAYDRQKQGGSAGGQKSAAMRAELTVCGSPS